jgi:hypothetical protein
MTPLSAQLSDLSERAKKTEDMVAATRTKNREQLDAHLAELKTTIDAGNKRVAETATAAQGKVGAWWDDARASVDERFASLRLKADTHRAEHDIKKAERTADEAEADAADAIAWALYVLEQAEYAAVDAVIARVHADELALGA